MWKTNSFQIILPKKFSQKISLRKILQKILRKNSLRISKKNPKKIQKFPKFFPKIQKMSKQFLKKFIRFWKHPIPYIALGGRKPFRACFVASWVCKVSTLLAGSASVRPSVHTVELLKIRLTPFWVVILSTSCMDSSFFTNKVVNKMSSWRGGKRTLRTKPTTIASTSFEKSEPIIF